jgi:hypothetical protein
MMAVLWDIAPCGLVEIDLFRRFRVMMEVVRTSETSVYFNETTWCYIPEHCHVHTRRCDNLKSHVSVNSLNAHIIFLTYILTLVKLCDSGKGHGGENEDFGHLDYVVLVRLQVLMATNVRTTVSGQSPW